MFRLRPIISRGFQRRVGYYFAKQKSSNVPSASDSDSKRLDTNDISEWSHSDKDSAATKDTAKLPTRAPLAKNFFVGILDKELMAYPEVIPRDDMATLQNAVLSFKNFFSEKAKEVQLPQLMDNVRQMGLYGINAPTEYDGKGWGWSESLIATEPETNCTEVALGLLSHRVIIDLLNEAGTVKQRQRYLSKCASGSFVGTEAIYEYDIPKDEFFGTTADYCPETKIWTLKGSKAYVVLSPLPTGSKQLFLVIAQTHRPNITGDAARGTTIFLVDSDFEGVKLGDEHITIGCRNVGINHVKFDQVRLSEDQIVGYAHEGNKVAEILSRSGRLRNSMLGMGMVKNMLSEMSEYCLYHKQCGVFLKDMEMTKTHLAKATCALYAMESMIYYTAGLLDEFEKQDVTLEAAITKYFTLKSLLKIAITCSDIIGAKSLHSGQSTEVAFRNAAQLYTQGESMDSLRLYIALSGLQHAGTLMSESVRMSRNPLFHPTYILSKLLDSSSIDNPKTKLRLGENVHPSLEPAAQGIERSLARMQMCVDLLFTQLGTRIVERHTDMQRIAEMATLIYAMFASTSRASRSYCIGLRLADHELLTASAIASYGHDRVKTLCTEVFSGQYMNNDNNLQRISNQLIKHKGYYPVHPMTYNF